MDNCDNSLIWDKPYYLKNGHPFIPLIFDGDPSSEVVPEQFNCIKITLDGRMQADLAWKQAHELAEEFSKQGYYLLWEIELGLFSNLPFQFTHQAQYLSLGLSIQHFRDTLWHKFSSNTLGLSIYRGPGNLIPQFPWDEQQVVNLREWLQGIFKDEQQIENELKINIDSFDKIEPYTLLSSNQGELILSLFCHNVAQQFVSLLTASLPDRLARYLTLDMKAISDPIWNVQILHPEQFEQISLIAKDSSLPVQAIGWDSPTAYGYLGKNKKVKIPDLTQPTIGVCLPSLDLYKPFYFNGLRESLNELISRNMNFKLIPESQLITNWDGLDHVIFVPSALSFQGKRKLQGFCAAGGIPVTVENEIGLPNEIHLTDLLSRI